MDHVVALMLHVVGVCVVEFIRNVVDVAALNFKNDLLFVVGGFSFDILQINVVG